MLPFPKYLYSFAFFLLSLYCISAAPVLAQARTDTSLAPGSQSLEKRRIFFVPDYESIRPGQPVAPLSTRQKFQLFAGQTFDPAFPAMTAVLAGIQQGFDLSPHYGGGASSYFQRFGATTASIATGTFLNQAVMPTLFHEDPRYFRRGLGSPAARFWYAVTRTVITRKDDGQRAFNYSLLSAVSLSVATTNLYFPDRDRTAGANAARFGYGIGLSALFNVIREFSNR